MKINKQVSPPFCIYGAGIVGASVYTAWKYLYNIVPEYFIVSSLENNPKEIDGVPVKVLKEINHKANKYLYVIAAPQIHYSAIIDQLKFEGIAEKQIILIDNTQENSIMEEYYTKRGDFLTVGQILSLHKEDNANKVEIQIYQARCHVDKVLNSSWELPKCIYPIQVGTSLTEQRIAPLLDNEGDNISRKNTNYCELTATYWVWKNKTIPYKGLCHYRRVFDLQDRGLEIILGSKASVDVILPYPTFYYPGMEVEHLRYVSQNDWKAMLQALKKIAPDYYTSYKSIAEEPYFYNYNMLIAKQEIFDDYSSFLFSVLEETEKRLELKETERSDRFAGYLAENLTTIYFRANKDKYKIVHAGKILLI